MQKEISELVNRAQLSLIYESRVYTTVMMSICSVFIYVLMSRYSQQALTAWLAVMLCVDAYRIVTAKMYAASVKKGDVDVVSARNHLIVGMTLSGLGWGMCTVILYPQGDIFNRFILFGVILGIMTGSITTLSYKKYIAMSYIALIAVPFVATILYVGQEAVIFSLMMVFYSLFLVKSIQLVYRSNYRLLVLEFEALEREKEIERQRSKAIQANAAKSEFLANISHELRTPMHAILGFSELGMNKDASQPGEKLKSYYPKIRENGKRLLGLLNDLLDLSKLEAGRMVLEKTPNDLIITIRSAVDQVESLMLERDITVVYDKVSGDTVCSCDSDKILQVMLNLLSNAVKFSPTGGRIIITLNDDEITVPVDESPEETHVVAALSVSVSDQGKGVPEDAQPMIFDKFVQANAKEVVGGTGLGLSICQEIINLHHGAISVCNNEDGGATFRFTIPR